MCKSCLKVEQRFATPFVVCSVAIVVAVAVVVVFGCLRGVCATWQPLNAA